MTCEGTWGSVTGSRVVIMVPLSIATTHSRSNCTTQLSLAASIEIGITVSDRRVSSGATQEIATVAMPKTLELFAWETLRVSAPPLPNSTRPTNVCEP